MSPKYSRKYAVEQLISVGKTSAEVAATFDIDHDIVLGWLKDFDFQQAVINEENRTLQQNLWLNSGTGNSPSV